MAAFSDKIRGGAKKLFGDITGSNKLSKATDKATQIQVETAKQVREDLQEYRDLGSKGINNTDFLLDPQTQADYLYNNPIFNASLKQLNRETKNILGARGKLDSGDLINSMQQNYFASALPFLDRKTQNINNLLSIGQNSAVQQGNIGLQAANSQAAGLIAAGGQRSQDFNNLLNLAATAATAGALSDARAKENIKHIGQDAEGNNLYEYSYKHESQPKYVGYMAQEVAQKDPESVKLGSDGYLRVSQKYAPVRVS